MTNSPCWTQEHGECRERHAWCHAKCERYQAWQVVHRIELQERFKAKSGDYDADRFERDAQTRHRKAYQEKYEKKRRGK